jgi:hypothetical protein
LLGSAGGRGDEVAGLERSDPRLAHAVVDVEPRVARLLTAMLEGMRPLVRAVP